MRKFIGTLCVLLGIVCLFCSVGFVLYNYLESENAANSTKSLLEDFNSEIHNQNHKQNNSKMPTVKVGGYDCIGVLSIPALGLELPVLTDWSYAKLKKAPCLYYGSYYEKDFVIAAHNYKSHFGRLSTLKKGDVVIFTNADGVARYYEVALLETLPKNATEEMITSGFDLSLYTCTLGGGSRVTVRCNLVQNQPK